MNQRIDYLQASPEALRALISLEIAVSRCGLESCLLTLSKLRASQINCCVFCIDLEAAEARRNGETAQRLAALAHWRDSKLFSARERAALGWSEALTNLAHGPARASALAELREQLSDAQIGDLTLTIAAINCWNRMGVGFRRQLS